MCAHRLACRFRARGARTRLEDPTVGLRRLRHRIDQVRDAPAHAQKLRAPSRARRRARRLPVAAGKLAVEVHVDLHVRVGVVLEAPSIRSSRVTPSARAAPRSPSDAARAPRSPARAAAAARAGRRASGARSRDRGWAPSSRGSRWFHSEHRTDLHPAPVAHGDEAARSRERRSPRAPSSSRRRTRRSRSCSVGGDAGRLAEARR